VLAIFGPTGVGKTALALAAAEQLRAQGEDPVAVSADALQVYRGLETLTGVASPEEQERLEHRLVSFVDVSQTFSAGEYQRLAHDEIDELRQEGATPIVVGGTGLYLQAALAQLDLKPPPPREVRERWTGELRHQGPEALHAVLSARDPEAADAIEPSDGHRVVRALELLDMGERHHASGGGSLWTRELRHPTRLIGLVMDRDALYEQIDARVDAMVAAGAEEEVRRADAAGASETARKALGFAELLKGDVDAMKRRTRQYAKRQLTWLRKLSDAELVDVTGRDPQDVAAELLVG